MECISGVKVQAVLFVNVLQACPLVFLLLLLLPIKESVLSVSLVASSFLVWQISFSPFCRFLFSLLIGSFEVSFISSQNNLLTRRKRVRERDRQRNISFLLLQSDWEDTAQSV